MAHTSSAVEHANLYVREGVTGSVQHVETVTMVGPWPLRRNDKTKPTWNAIVNQPNHHTSRRPTSQNIDGHSQASQDRKRRAPGSNPFDAAFGAHLEAQPPPRSRNASLESGSTVVASSVESSPLGRLWLTEALEEADRWCDVVRHSWGKGKAECQTSVQTSTDIGTQTASETTRPGVQDGTCEALCMCLLVTAAVGGWVFSVAMSVVCLEVRFLGHAEVPKSKQGLRLFVAIPGLTWMALVAVMMLLRTTVLAMIHPRRSQSHPTGKRVLVSGLLMGLGLAALLW
jgi:hypothetical protein